MLLWYFSEETTGEEIILNKKDARNPVMLVFNMDGKIEKALEVCEKVYEEEMKPYQREYGLDVTYLSRKEKAELVNKRNCLITQIKQLLAFQIILIKT